MKIWKNAVLFYLGGMGYVGLELLWRRRSSSSMFVLGGICFLALGTLGRFAKTVPAGLRAVAGAGIITGLELIAGMIVNRQHQIWNYTRLPLHFLGQICLPYSLLWIPVAWAAMELHRLLNRAIDHSVSF